MAEDSLLEELVGNGKLYAPELSRAARRWFTQRLPNASRRQLHRWPLPPTAAKHGRRSG
jgi:hypothetical protein